MADFGKMLASSGRAFLLSLTPEKQWGYDICLIAAAWLAARIPLIAWGVPPLVQCDSFCYQNFYNTIRRPHYPFMYGQFLEYFGHYHGMIIQHFLVLACAVMLYFIARGAAGRGAGLLAGILTACYGGFVLYAHSIMSETLFNFFLACHLLFLWLGIRREEARDGRYMALFFLAGLFVGIAANVRPVIQYQTGVVCLVLLPFYVFRRAWGGYIKIAAMMTAGFLLVYLYVAGATYRHYGIFGLSSGLPKALMYRLVDNPKAPLADVATSDPEVAAVRDYLVELGHDDDVIWLHAYEHIIENILPRLRPGKPAGLLDVDLLVMKLWRGYVITHPYQYFRKTMQGFWGIVFVHEYFSGLWEFSERMYQKEHKILPEETVRALSFFYLLLSAGFTGGLALVVVVVLAVIYLFKPGRPEKMYMACMLATMFFLFVPQFFASPGIPRYRYPLDMVYFLVLGVLCFYRGTLTASPGNGKAAAGKTACAE